MPETHPSAFLPDPISFPELFEGLIVRRAAAFLLDTAIIMMATVIMAVLIVIVGSFNAGIGLMGLLFLPISIIGYYGFTLGSHRRATVGMRAMDLVLTPTSGGRLDGPVAFLHTALFYLTFWISWPIVIIVLLFNPRRQMIHDMVTRTLMLRRSPMERHWRRYGAQEF